MTREKKQPRWILNRGALLSPCDGAGCKRFIDQGEWYVRDEWIYCQECALRYGYPPRVQDREGGSVCSTDDLKSDLQIHASAALNVLRQVQHSLERIEAGDGTAALLPTIARLLGSVSFIVEMADTPDAGVRPQRGR